MREKLQQILATFDELTAKLGDPAVLADQKEYTRLAKAQRAQAALAEKAREYLSAPISSTRPRRFSSTRATRR